jgi:hypothetical protein
VNRELVDLIKAALECSIHLSPMDPGLTGDEMREFGRRSGFQDGEIGDAMMQASSGHFGIDKFMPPPDIYHIWRMYLPEDPELRNFTAHDFVVSTLNERVRADGMAAAQIDKQVLVQRGEDSGLTRTDMEAAITYQILAEVLAEKDGALKFPNKGGQRVLPSTMRGSLERARKSPTKAKALPIVKDIISRRTDGRARFAEPLDAFSDALMKLGFGIFRLWWTQTVAELRRCDPASTPLSAAVLSAALVEGALTFIVKHARALDLEIFRSPDFARPTTTWKMDDLIRQSGSGGAAAVLTPQAKARAETLCQSRQRIHAGRMLVDFPSGVPDLRPEEARAAKATAEEVVRCVLDWLEKYPARPD